jgi:puromycin-sensitive aminopeptidase
MAAEQSAEQFRGQPRLPKFATPRRYDLRLTPDLDACAFSGSVAVSLDVASPTRFLVLNAAELDVAPGAVSFAPQGSDKVISRSRACLLAVSWGVSTSEFDLFSSEVLALEF